MRLLTLQVVGVVLSLANAKVPTTTTKVTVEPTYQLADSASSKCLRLSTETAAGWGEIPVSGSSICTPAAKQVATLFAIDNGAFVSLSEKMQGRVAGCLTATGYAHTRSSSCVKASATFLGPVGTPVASAPTYGAVSKLSEVSSFYNDCALTRTATLAKGNAAKKTCAAMKKKLGKKITRLADFLSFHLDDFDQETDAAVPSRDPAHLGVFAQLAVASLAAFPGGEPMARDAIHTAVGRTSAKASFDPNFTPVAKTLALEKFAWTPAQWNALAAYTANGESFSDFTGFTSIAPQMTKVYESVKNTKRASIVPEVCGQGVGATKLGEDKKVWQEGQWCQRWRNIATDSIKA